MTVTTGFNLAPCYYVIPHCMDVLINQDVLAWETWVKWVSCLNLFPHWDFIDPSVFTGLTILDYRDWQASRFDHLRSLGCNSDDDSF
ncbi:hypothetical protein OUZ56_005308 [Daphnia magna]|uniref:Uncharacterized protein n=1 Tax=Daphnia magna TaxID=35525 RepID=A0ABQ9YSN4_9CRUS|nr:hypothetical protein OUZ56_005308 [Daphnia magna]